GLFHVGGELGQHDVELTQLRVVWGVGEEEVGDLAKEHAPLLAGRLLGELDQVGKAGIRHRGTQTWGASSGSDCWIGRPWRSRAGATGGAARVGGSGSKKPGARTKACSPAARGRGEAAGGRGLAALP